MLFVDHIDLLRSAMHKVKALHPFYIDAIVILPDHLHAIWTLPEGDDGYPMRWALIKAGFSRQVPHVRDATWAGNRKGSGESGNGVIGST
jgi:putative transposase